MNKLQNLIYWDERQWLVEWTSEDESGEWRAAVTGREAVWSFDSTDSIAVIATAEWTSDLDAAIDMIQGHGLYPNGKEQA